MLLLMTAGLRLCAEPVALLPPHGPAVWDYLKQSEEYDSEDDPVDTSQPWTVHPTKKDLSDEYRNWSCQGLRVYVMPGNFVPFSFVSHSPEAVRVRVSGSQRFTVEGDDKDCHQEFQGQDFTFPLSSTKKEVQKFMFPDLLEKKMEVELQLQLEEENGVVVARTSYGMSEEEEGLLRECGRGETPLTQVQTSVTSSLTSHGAGEQGAAPAPPLPGAGPSV